MLHHLFYLLRTSRRCPYRSIKSLGRRRIRESSACIHIAIATSFILPLATRPQSLSEDFKLNQVLLKLRFALAQQPPCTPTAPFNDPQNKADDCETGGRDNRPLMFRAHLELGGCPT